MASTAELSSLHLNGLTLLDAPVVLLHFASVCLLNGRKRYMARIPSIRRLRRKRNGLAPLSLVLKPRVCFASIRSSPSSFPQIVPEPVSALFAAVRPAKSCQPDPFPGIPF